MWRPSPYGPRLSALVGLLGSVFPLSFSKTQALLDQLLGVEISRGAIPNVRERLSAVLTELMAQALEAARQQPVAYVDETGAPTGNADGNNPSGKRGWQWVMVTAAVTVFLQGMSRSTAAAIELLGSTFGGIVVSDRFSAYNHLPIQQRQLCWAHLIRDLTAIAERPGVSADNEVGRSATSSLAGGVSAGDPGADAQGPGDAGTTDKPPTQSVHDETTRRQQPGGCCRSGGHLSAQCSPD